MLRVRRTAAWLSLAWLTPIVVFGVSLWVVTPHRSRDLHELSTRQALLVPELLAASVAIAILGWMLVRSARSPALALLVLVPPVGMYVTVVTAWRLSATSHPPFEYWRARRGAR
jgi:hypothetical protein